MRGPCDVSSTERCPPPLPRCSPWPATRKRRTKAEARTTASALGLTAPPTADWPTNGGNLYNQRYSPLTSINRSNVAQLKGVWRARLRGSGAAPQYSGFAQPLVYGGVAYVSTGANDVFAVSIDTGEMLWQYSANLPEDLPSVCCGWNNKGVAVSEDKVFIGRLDGQLVALDRATGKVAWSIQAERSQDRFSITAAPLYVNGRVIIGFAGGDRGTRSRVKAYDAKDGRLIWTFYTIPGPGEPGHETWPKDNDAWKYGGAAIWQTPAVDPELGLLYFSTSNAAPDYNGAVRAGDNLYAASMLAIEARDGQVSLALSAGASRHLGLRRGQSRRPDGRERRRAHAQGDCRSRQDRLGVHPRSAEREAADRHRRAPGAAGAAAGDRRDAAVPARRRHRAATDPDRPGRIRARQRRPHLHAVRRQGPTIVAPGIWGGASWPPSAYDPVQQRLFVCASSVINGYTGGGDPKFVPPATGGLLRRRQDDVHAHGAHRHHRGARRDHQQARVAVPVARAVLQRHARDRPAGCCSSAATTDA